MEQSFKLVSAPSNAICPGFGPYPDQPETEQMRVSISKNALDKLTEKIVRGITYIVDGKLIEKPYLIESMPLTDANAASIFADIPRQFWQTYERPPGITVIRAVTPQDEITAIYKITIWGRLKSYVFVMRDGN